MAEASVGKIEKVGAGSSVKVARGGSSVRLHEGDALEVGDEVTTDANTAVDIRLEDETLIRVGVNSSYKVQEDSKFHSLMHRLLSGVVRVLVKPTEKDHQKDAAMKFRMQTPEGTIGVRGTEFVVLRIGAKTQLKGLDGEVLFGPAESELTDPKTTVSVTRGFESEILAGAHPNKAEKFKLKEYLNFINGAGGPFGPLSGRTQGNTSHYARNSDKPAPVAEHTAASNVAIAPPPQQPQPKEPKEKPAPKDYQCILVKAALDGDLAAAKDAVAHHADVNAACAKSKGNTPLQAAVVGDQRDMFLYLVKEGANVNLADSKGNTPLMLAADNANHVDMEFIKALVYPAGADLTYENSAGKTAAQIAKSTGYEEAYKYLSSDQAQDDYDKAIEDAHKRNK